jgi:hypothetical protein
MLRGSAYAPVAQLDRVPGFEPGGREFESLRARHSREPANSYAFTTPGLSFRGANSPAQAKASHFNYKVFD